MNLKRWVHQLEEAHKPVYENTTIAVASCYRLPPEMVEIQVNYAILSRLVAEFSACTGVAAPVCLLFRGGVYTSFIPHFPLSKQKRLAASSLLESTDTFKKPWWMSDLGGHFNIRRKEAVVFADAAVLQVFDEVMLDLWTPQQKMPEVDEIMTVFHHRLHSRLAEIAAEELMHSQQHYHSFTRTHWILYPFFILGYSTPLFLLLFLILPQRLLLLKIYLGMVGVTILFLTIRYVRTGLPYPLFDFLYRNDPIEKEAKQIAQKKSLATLAREMLSFTITLSFEDLLSLYLMKLDLEKSEK